MPSNHGYNWFQTNNCSEWKEHTTPIELSHNHRGITKTVISCELQCIRWCLWHTYHMTYILSPFYVRTLCGGHMRFINNGCHMVLRRNNPTFHTHTACFNTGLAVVVFQLPTRKWRRAPNLSFNLFLRVCTLNSTVAKHELLHQPTHLHKSYYRSCITVVICNLTTLHYWPTQYTLRPAYVRTCIPLLHIHVCMYKASSKTSTVYLLLLIVIRCTMYIQVPKSQ